MVSGFESREGIDPESPIRDVLKSCFLDLNKKEVEKINKGSRRVSKHVEFWVKNVFDERKVFHGLIQQNQLLIFQKMNFLL
jgi:hypothetical protein